MLGIELEDPMSKARYWSFPGGAIEPGETPEVAAIRETLEETGYQVTLTSDVFSNRYAFHWNGKVFDCTTHWFSARPEHDIPALVDDAEYLLKAAWLKWPACRHQFLDHAGINQAIAHFLTEDN